MSLQNIAQHVAQQGRGNDKMLVHMSAQEVGALQKLAQQHGLPHLTTNPNTGLPEAGFLDSILPTVLGAGISYLTDGAVSPAMLGLGVGAASAVASGSIQKGLMAGLGAYGGAGLEAGLAGAGAANLGTDALTAAQSSAADLINQGVITPDMTDAYVQQQVGDKMASATPLDKLSAGISGLSSEAGRSSALNAIGGTKGAVTTGLAALAPMMTMSQPTVSMPGTNASPTAYVQTKMVNPYTKQLYDVSKVPASQFTGTYQDQINNADLSRYIGKAAGGGLMGLAHGGAVKHFDDGGDVAAASAAPDAAVNANYTPQQISDYISQNQLSGAALTAAENQYGVTPTQVAYAEGQTLPQTPLVIGAASDPSNPFGQALLNSSTVIPPGNIGASTAQAAQGVASTPAYTTYSNADLSSFFSNPANAAVLNTPAGLAAAEAKYNADPNAVNAYLQQNANQLNLSAGDVYGVTHGMGLQGIYNNMDAWVAAHPNATGADITAALQSSGLNQNDVQNYFNRPNSAYGTNLTTGKAFTGAGDIYTIGQNQGFSNINNNIDQWIADHPATTTTLAQAQAAMSQYGINETDVMRATGKTSAQLYQDLKKQTPVINTGGGGGTGDGGGTYNPATYATNAIQNTPASTLKSGVSGITGPGIEGGGTVVNANGTITESPVLPGIPQGGFTGMQNLLDTYTKGGGSTGYVSPTVSSMDEFNSKYNTLSGGTKAAYNYLMGQGNYPIAPSSSTGQVMIPYSESVLGIPQSATIPDTQKYYVDSKTHVLTLNPNYSTASTGSGSGVGNTASTSGATGNSLVGTSINVNGNKAVYDPVSGYYLINGQYYNADGTPSGYNPSSGATGGLMSMAHGGMADGGYNLGGYSDGGRLLRGPGDGVSDDIPATIGHKQPARLADGEFVVPARIVSELGNGSTEAGAKQLYAMMDRVQKARGKTVGKNKVATNTKAAKYLPA